MPLRPEVVSGGLSVRLAQIRYGAFFGIEGCLPKDTGSRRSVDTSSNPRIRFEVLSACESNGMPPERFPALLDADALLEKFALVLVPFCVTGVYPLVEAFRAALPADHCHWAAYAVYLNAYTSFIDGTNIVPSKKQ